VAPLLNHHQMATSLFRGHGFRIPGFGRNGGGMFAFQSHATRTALSLRRTRGYHGGQPPLAAASRKGREASSNEDPIISAGTLDANVNDQQPAAQQGEQAPAAHLQPSSLTDWEQVTQLVSSLSIPQLPSSLINVQAATSGYLQLLLTATRACWEDYSLPSTEGVPPLPPTELRNPPACLRSLIVCPGADLDPRSTAIITSILSGTLPTLPADELCALFLSPPDQDGRTIMDWLGAIALQDRRVLALMPDHPMLQVQAACRHDMYQWLNTLHHFPLRTCIDPDDLFEVGPHMVWALVWLHHHVLGALKAWAEGRLSRRQLANIYGAAVR
jgi:hypothetical protein